MNESIPLSKCMYYIIDFTSVLLWKMRAIWLALVKELNFPVVNMVPVLAQSNMLLTVYSSICFHLVVAKPNSDEFVSSFVSSFIHPCVHRMSAPGKLLSCTKDYRRCWFSLARGSESGMILRQRSCRAWKMWSFLPGSHFWEHQLPSWHSLWGMTHMPEV